MQVKVHWIIDGVADIEAETPEEAENKVENELSDLITNFRSEKIEEFVLLNKEIKENFSKKRDDKEFELRRRQELILDKSIN